MSELAVISKPNASIETYGRIENVQAVAARLKLMMPGGAKYTDEEVLALAQAAVAYDLNPINGEIWMIKAEDKDGKPGKAYGLMIGIRGQRKWAKASLHDASGNFWPTFERVDNAEERRRVAPNADPNAVIYLCKLYDTETLRAYTRAMSEMRAAGIPYDDAKQCLGTQPYTPGYGMAWTGERSTMQIAQRAMKRAEADALKRRFGIPPGFATPQEEAGQESAAEVIEGWAIQSGNPQAMEWAATQPIEGQAPVTPEQHADNQAALGHDTANHGEEGLLADAPAPSAEARTPAIKAHLDKLAKSYEASGKEANDKQRKLALLVLKELCGNDETKRHTMQKQLLGVEHWDEITSPNMLALIKWMDPARDEAGNYHPNLALQQEVEAVCREALVANGQLALI